LHNCGVYDPALVSVICLWGVGPARMADRPGRPARAGLPPYRERSAVARSNLAIWTGHTLPTS